MTNNLLNAKYTHLKNIMEYENICIKGSTVYREMNEKDNPPGLGGEDFQDSFLEGSGYI